ncbi:MAG: DUF4926 domain-containing protein [Chloroflexi bacterium]|nr:DUF4926 domain-containing protein [Chloroflexota bacterium]
MKELDVVALTVDLPEHGLKSGVTGTIVLEHSGGEAYEVEFITFAGETIALVALTPDQVRPVSPDEVPHARLVESST